ncbi:hypothetical protein CCR75_003405 [Bremia lactucae]|uniref:Uncharacterized protein n=1 Tax=Bremia lactucae TaxID=4779 RepID=A0A976NY83_BRELC|nr:hypothetical protein CCR75_003405 [Bremia lactucae]
MFPNLPVVLILDVIKSRILILVCAPIPAAVMNASLMENELESISSYRSPSKLSMDGAHESLMLAADAQDGPEEFNFQVYKTVAY